MHLGTECDSAQFLTLASQFLTLANIQEMLFKCVSSCSVAFEENGLERLEPDRKFCFDPSAMLLVQFLCSHDFKCEVIIE